MLVQAVVICIGVYPAAKLYGIDGVCLLTTVVSIGVLVYFLVVFSRVFESSLRSIVSPMVPPLLSSVVMYFFLSVIALVLPKDLIALAVLSAIGAAVYLVSLQVTSRGKDVRHFVDLIRDSRIG